MPVGSHMILSSGFYPDLDIQRDDLDKFLQLLSLVDAIIPRSDEECELVPPVVIAVCEDTKQLLDMLLLISDTPGISTSIDRTALLRPASCRLRVCQEHVEGRVTRTF